MRGPNLAIALIVLSVSQIFAQSNTNVFNREAAEVIEKIYGFDFSDEKTDMLLPGLKEQLGNYTTMRRQALSNSIPPAMQFNPLPVGFKFETTRRSFKASSPGKVKLPAPA